jgi:leucyl aminopeptidase (aminopeptidase T)
MAANTRLIKAARTALKDYLGLYEDETLLIVADENTFEVGSALYQAGKELCKEAFILQMKPREDNGQEPPDQIAELMKTVDVVVCPTTKSLTHTDARRNASKLGVRVATMPGITKDIMTRCLSADADEIVTLTNHLTKMLEKTREVRVVTKSGTDITMPIKGMNIIPSTGVLKKIGASGNLPSGEVFCAPVEGKTNGVVVFDGSIAGIGKLEEPVKVTVKDGIAVSFEGGKEAKMLETMLNKHGERGKWVAEFGIGTNPKAKITGQILEDEKAIGTIHIAFGNNISMGGTNNVHVHIDGLVKKPDLYLDGEMIMVRGKVVL